MVIFRNRLKAIIFSSLLLGLHSTTCKSQLYLGIEPVSRDKTPFLEQTLKDSHSDKEKVNALLQLGTIYFDSPYPKTPNLNLAMQLAKNAIKLSSEYRSNHYYNEALLLTAFIFLRQNLPDSAISILPKMNDSTRFKLLLAISHFFRSADDADRKAFAGKAMNFVLQAKDLNIKLNDTLNKILINKEIACIHASMVQPRSESELLNVIKSLEGIGYPYLHYAYFDLSLLEYYLGNYDKALNYTQLGLKSMSQTNDSTNLGDLYLIHGCILRKMSNHDSSLKNLLLASNYYQLKYGEEGMPDAVIYLAEEFVKLNRGAESDKVIPALYAKCAPDNGSDSIRWFQALGDFYRLRKNYPKAEKYCQLRIDLQSRLNRLPDFYSLGQVYLEAGEYAKAKPYLEKALKSVDYSYSIIARAHLEYCLFLVDSAEGNYLSAIRHLSKNKRFNDSVMSQAKVDAVEKYKAQYETERKVADLKLKDQQIDILTKDRQLKEMYLQKANFIKNAALIGISILIIVGVLMNIQYRQKRKAMKTIAQMNTELQRSLAEKEWLLKEVHHRVKNNLHTIMCLLESQAMYLEKDALQAIEKSQHRIYAMSLIHQKLYQNGDVKSIDMEIYLNEFVRYLKDSFDVDRIEFIFEVGQIHLNLSQAIPVALIINEAVTNSIKYAFGRIANPRISISMNESAENVTLIIADNGQGFRPVAESELKSLGIQLIKGLGKEINGNVMIKSDNGTIVTVQFIKETIASTEEIMQKELAAHEEKNFNS